MLTRSGVKISANDPILLNAIVVEHVLESYQAKAESLTDDVICKNLSTLENSLTSHADRMEKMNASYISNTKQFIEVFDKTVKAFQAKENEKLDEIVRSIASQSKAPYITMTIICSLVSLAIGVGLSYLFLTK